MCANCTTRHLRARLPLLSAIAELYLFGGSCVQLALSSGLPVAFLSGWAHTADLTLLSRPQAVLGWPLLLFVMAVELVGPLLAHSLYRWQCPNALSRSRTAPCVPTPLADRIRGSDSSQLVGKAIQPLCPPQVHGQPSLPHLPRPTLGRCEAERCPRCQDVRSNTGDASEEQKRLRRSCHSHPRPPEHKAARLPAASCLRCGEGLERCRRPLLNPVAANP